MFTPLKVTVPTPVLVTPMLPPRIALADPACRSNALVLVSVPPLPLMLPPVSCTPPTVSLLAPMSSVPADTTTLAVSEIWLDCCNTVVPPATLRLPAIELAAVVLRLSVPALTVVNPVYEFAPAKVNMPAPSLVSAPLVAAPAPVSVRLLAVTSIVDVVPVVSVKSRLVEAFAPVYCKVPPPSTRLPAAAVAAPRLPATPPSPMVATLSVPALIVVTPV